MTVSSYLHAALDPKKFPKTIRRMTKFLKARQHEFDAIAVRGVSGVLVGGPLSLRLRKPLIVVRKKEDNSHSCYRIEGDKTATRYVIIDDLIASGRTVKHIIDGMKDFNGGRLVGILLYNDCMSDRGDTPDEIRSHCGNDYWLANIVGDEDISYNIME
jgi:adenine/guanine phosphoribosyltransferase-like PRPP-binding protein